MKIKAILGEDAIYDKRNLVLSISRTRKYPSKKMFVEFLKKYSDIKADVEIWSERDHVNSTETIMLKLVYKVPNLPKRKNKK